MESRKICIILVSVLVIATALLFKELSDSDRVLSSLYVEKSKIKGAGKGIFTNNAISKGKYLFTTIIKIR